MMDKCPICPSCECTFNWADDDSALIYLFDPRYPNGVRVPSHVCVSTILFDDDDDESNE